MKNILVTILLTLISISVTSQKLNIKNPLPIDKSIRKGVLENGMTYYLHSTDVTKNVASYYIIQNVGSVLENDNQQGLAHFLEHMAFNGTKNFPGKGILNTLEKEGIVFGKDINAYTSFEETVYNVNNIPTSPKLINTGLQILHDWSNYLSLTDKEIDAERGVIKEEWRTRQSGQMRILKKSLPVLFNNSKYAKRLPIGLMSIIDNFKYKALRDFYHDWYRTDLQAIAIVGDFDVDEMEAKIKSKFYTIPKVKNAPERFLIEIKDSEKLQFNLAMDDEVSTSTISFGIRHKKPLGSGTVESLKESLLNSMITTILSKRYNEISLKPNAPFMGIGVSYNAMSRLHNAFNVKIYPQPNRQQEAFKLALLEINRAVKFGFTKAEINRTIAEFTNSYENRIAKINDRSHGQIIRTIQSNYLENVRMTDITKEFEIAKSLFTQFSQNQIQKQLKKIYKKNNRIVTVTGVKGKNNLTKESALKIINTTENDSSLKGYEEELALKPLMSGVDITKGNITLEKENKNIGSTIFTLSNGVKVHYKFVNKNKNEVKLEAISNGGLSLLSNEKLPSASLISSLVQISGQGEFSMTDLSKVLTGKTARTSISIGEISEDIYGSSTTKDVETMLKLVNLRFTKPRFDEKSYTVLMQNINNYLIRKSENIQAKMQDSITTTLYGKNHPKKRLFDNSYVADMSYKKMKSIYNDRFSNAADFTFFIVGDVTKEKVKPLLEKYIASIPTSKFKENWKDNSTSWTAKKIDKDVYLKMKDPKTSVRIAIKNKLKYTLKNALLMRTLGDILKMRYLESLREKEGGTYGASSRGQLTKKPKEQAYLTVTFDCNPDLAEKLISIVHKEMKLIRDGKVNQSDLDKVLKSFLKAKKERKNYNSYDMSLLKNYVIEGYDMNNTKNFEGIIKSISVRDVQKTMKKLLKDSKSYEIVFKPKK